MASSCVLVTGATGFIGAHVVDNLLNRGIKVRAAARSRSKAEIMIETRPFAKSILEFVYINDIAEPNVFDQAMQGVDAVIHLASPLNYSVADKERELIIPAINGVRSILQAAAKNNIKRFVMTSSFGAVLDMDREKNTPWTYTAEDWNPISYAEAADPSASPQDAYRGSKKFAEQEAWKFMAQEKPAFELVTLCPSMVFGPTAHPVKSVDTLNESNALLWRVASGVEPLPPARFNFWIDVRDLAEVHVQALLNPNAGGKRYLPVSSQKFSYQLVSEIMRDNFPAEKDRISSGVQEINENVHVDTAPVTKDLNIEYRDFKDTIVDFLTQAYLLEMAK
ncbi:dihydroflavonal-4-reductase-2 [Coleophoma crateriformis]|uniref:Dihydroflavonal-4-reductase-2 n=1 Tax=Coleophoma crateriformis TaxID=565419 RepID=A0A3D8RQ13_9HELO|nr:dihydroflavonal-4-reductase-2 [Coleophoma crateriformis]